MWPNSQETDKILNAKLSVKIVNYIFPLHFRNIQRYSNLRFLSGMWSPNIGSSHQNKKALSSFYHKKKILIENECLAFMSYLTFTFYQKYLLW